MKQHTRAAFSLIEVMVAVALSAIGIVGGLSLLNSQWSLIRRGQEHLYVGHVLESRIEEIRDLTFDELDALPANFTFSVLPATTVYGKPVNPSVVAADDSDYERELRESTGRVAIETLDTDLRKVTVEVTWLPALGSDSASAVMTTYVTRNGINGQ